MFLFVLCAFFAFCIYCLVVIIEDMHRFVIVPYEIKSDKIRKKYTFVMLSDLHNKSYGKENDKLLQAIDEINPDSIFTAGDMYTSKVGSGYENALAVFKGLAGKYPVYIANGNHEHKTQVNPKEFHGMYEKFTTELKKLDLEPLVNQHVILPEANINLCGLQIDREYFRHFKRMKMPDDYLEGLTGQADSDRFQILLAHTPDYFEAYEKWGADLVLSGHIHGGIVRIPFLGGAVSPVIRLFPRYDGGLYKGKRGSSMILGRGLGTHTLPVRLWNPGEIVVVTLLPNK